MDQVGGLEQRLASLLGDVAERRAKEHTERDEAMKDVEARRIPFERTAFAWVTDLVIPRLRALGKALPPSGDVEQVEGGCSARLNVGSSEEYPVAASLTVSIAPDVRYEHATVHVQPLLIPMLVGHPAAACSEFELDPKSKELLARFLDDQFMVFAESYMRVREPDSPHQRSLLVTDPVCGMTLHPTDSVESQDYEGRRYFFCAAVCAQRFRESPEHFLKWRKGAIGGVP